MLTLSVKASGTRISAPGGGGAHYHVFVDRDPVPIGATIPRDRGIVHAATSPILVPGLSVGEHRLAVVLGDASHVRLDHAAATLTATVTGPSLRATAPATSAEGEPWTVRVSVSGVKIVAPDGDVSGTTGHYHFFIDRDPSAPGETISEDAEGVVHTIQSAVPLTGLEAGEHTIWIVLGDGDHRTLAPMVADRVTVTITV